MPPASFTFDQLEPVASPIAASPFGPPAAAAAPEVDVEALLEQARAEGYAAGAADARTELAPAGNAMAVVAGELQALRDQVAGQAERAAVELALQIAAQAVQGAIAVDPDRVVDVVRGALRRLMERERVLVLVHPEDLDVVRSHADALVSELGGIEHYELQADRRVTRGGAIVRTAEGEVDATLETKLARAREVVEHDLAG